MEEAFKKSQKKKSKGLQVGGNGNLLEESAGMSS